MLLLLEIMFGIKKILTIGLAYSFQRINQIPADKNDVKLDFIVTNKKN